MPVRLLLAALALALVTACASKPQPAFSWDGYPDEHYRYALYHQVNGEWQFEVLTNDKRIRCVYDVPWRDPITAVRLQERESGRVIKTLDCTKR